MFSLTCSISYIHNSAVFNIYVLIPGASSGIGQGIATEYAKYGPYLALTGRSMERLEETKKLCIGSGLDDSKVSAIIMKFKVHLVLNIIVNFFIHVMHSYSLSCIYILSL